jgi:hypothetical protein
LLRVDGFTGAGRTYRRIRDGWIQLVNVQGSRYGGEFAINLAVHPLMIPDLRGEVPNQKRVTAGLCEFRRRLTETRSDQWWKHDHTVAGMTKAMREAAELYRRIGRPLIERVSGPGSPLMTVTASEFAAGTYDFAGFASTEARMALALARLRSDAGCAEEARSFARYGLEHIGISAYLRGDLERLAGAIGSE